MIKWASCNREIEWSRKKYPAFNCLKNAVRICVLCIAFIIIVIPIYSQVNVNDDSLKLNNFEIEEIVITPGQKESDGQGTASITTIINRTEIERTPFQSLNEILRYTPGVDIRQRGPFGAQADVSLRGGTFDQTLILLNGINLTDPQTGHHNLNLPIDLESIEKIEILQGPSSKSYGPNAFNGAINIITGNSKPDHLRLSATYGQFGFYKTSANLSSTFRNFNHFISFNNSSTDGYIKNTDYLSTNIFYQASYLSEIGTFDLQTGFNKKDFGANSFYSLRFPSQFEATKTGFASLRYKTNTKIKISSAFYIRGQRDRFELRRDTLPFNHHLTTVSGVDLDATGTTMFGKTKIGIDFRNEHIVSNVLGIPLNNPVEVTGFKDIYYTKYYNRFNTTIFAEQTFTWNSLSIDAGAMIFHNKSIKKIKVYPGADVSFSLNDYLKLYLSAGKTLRIPTFTDLFYKSPSQEGNSDLEPEEALNTESGIKYSAPLLKGNITFFRRHGTRMIDWVKDVSPDSLIWRSMNHTSIRFTGIESSVSYTPLAGNPLSRIQAIKISYSFMKANIENNPMLSRYALDYLKHQVTSGIDIRLGWKLFVSNSFTFNSRNGSFQDLSGQTSNYKPFLLADSKLYWKSEQYTVFAEASNIFNVSYYDFGGLIQPGRWLRGGIVLDLDFIDRIKKLKK